MEELKKIKKMYGEDFMKLCRQLFPTLLETEGKLYEILTLYFSNNSRLLCNDIIENGLESEFKNFIYSKIDVEHPDKIIIEEKTPYKLLDEAGYKLKECTTEKEIQKFKKYYKPGEELCTFEGGRLERCYVFFAVRKDVEKIRREDFANPKREDEYGTSVMGIQFNKEGKCTVSIKNRYNHRVNNPDATYGNDLDRIIPGLTQSFGRLLKERGLDLNSSNIEKFEIPNYVVANDGKYYKFNMEINGTYYCPGNIVIENREAHKIENPEKQILMDYFILDIENKTIKLYDENCKDSFVDGLHDIEKTEIVNNKEEKTKRIIIQKKGQDQPIIIELNQENQIIGYENSGQTLLGDNFLRFNKALKKLELQNVRNIGNYCLTANKGLKRLSMPNVTSIGDYLLHENEELEELEIPNGKNIGNYCMSNNKKLERLEALNLTKVGYDFLCTNEELKQFEAPNLIDIGANCLAPNNKRFRQLDSGKIMPVDESKFAQIYDKSKGRIKEVFAKIKSFIKEKSNDKMNEGDIEERE